MQQSVKALLRLRELILNGELKPGDRLSELSLVDRLKVSRTPLRLALVRLEEEGLIQALSAGGYVVRAFTEADAFDAIEIRGTLEGMAARLAAEAASPKALMHDLKSCLQALDVVVEQTAPTVDDFSDYVALNERFHALVVELAGSPVLQRSVAKASALPFASPSAFVMAQAQMPQARYVMLIAQEHHRCLAHAIEAGEGARAEALAREHARLAKRNLEAVLRNHHAFQQMPGAALIRRGHAA